MTESYSVAKWKKKTNLQVNEIVLATFEDLQIKLFVSADFLSSPFSRSDMGGHGHSAHRSTLEVSEYLEAGLYRVKWWKV